MDTEVQNMLMELLAESKQYIYYEDKSYEAMKLLESHREYMRKSLLAWTAKVDMVLGHYYDAK